MFDQLWAYCGNRAVLRNSTKDVRVHAVGLSALLSGAMDAECGEIGRVPMGDWDPAMAHACPHCIAVLAGDVAVPEELAALRAPASARQCGTPSLFAAA